MVGFTPVNVAPSPVLAVGEKEQSSTSLLSDHIKEEPASDVAISVKNENDPTESDGSKNSATNTTFFLNISPHPGSSISTTPTPSAPRTPSLTFSKLTTATPKSVDKDSEDIKPTLTPPSLAPDLAALGFTTPHHGNPYFFPQQRSRSNPPLDLSTVKRRKDIDHNIIRGVDQTKSNASPEFITKTFPTFTPTEEEFKDPVSYIQSIADIGKKYGAVKIIPPESWDLPFCLDTELFWFKTKRLTFSSTSSTRQIRDSFVASLYHFHKFNGTTINKLPLIDKRPLDLYHLHHSVKLRGGFDRVCKKKLWAQIGRELGYSGKIMTSLSTSLKSAYVRILHPYDNYLIKQGADEVHNGTSIATFTVPEDVTLGSKRPHPDGSLTDLSRIKRLRLEDGTEIAFGILSDSSVPCISNAQKSIYRLRPYTSAASVPSDPSVPPFDRWHKGLELIEVDDSFVEAPIYNLRQFQQKANIFHENYFATMNRSNYHTTEPLVEKEFWRLVSEPTQSIEVEGGYDIHTSTQGSPSPQVERNADSAEYVRDPWNLNALPFNENSYSRHIAESVPFLVQPWVHVGMLFSSEAWHFEDFFSYMINYHHFGETKTWYSVPEKDFEKFQNLLINTIGQEAIDSTPSLLLESDCMFPPEELKKHGIDCYSVDQQPGEFVLTFPKAYNCSFNHGFNLSESVHLLPTFDWLDYGMQCVDFYNHYRREPPFSIQRLLLNVSSNTANVSTAQVLSPLMEKMYAEEIKLRNEVQRKYPLLNVQENDGWPELNDAGQLECSYCSYTRDICYLSRIVHLLTDDVISLRKFIELDIDEDELSDYRMILRYGNDEFKTLCTQLTDRASLPSQWYAKLTQYITNNPRPPLKGLKTLVGEGEKIPVPMMSLVALKEYVEKATRWQEEVQSLLTRKSQIRRSSEKGVKGHKQNSSPEPDEPKDRQYFQKLLDEAHNLSFWTMEIGQLHDRGIEVLNYQKLVDKLLSQPHRSLQEYEEALDVGRNLNISLSETDMLSKIVSGMQWHEKATRELSSTYLALEDLNTIITEGEMAGIDEKDSQLEELRSRQVSGEQLDEKLRKTLAADYAEIEYLDYLASEVVACPVRIETMEMIRMAQQKHANIIKQVEHIHSETKKASVNGRPAFKYVKRVIDEAKSLNTKPKIFLIEKDFRIVEDWMRRGKRMVGKGNAPMYIFASHLSIIEQKTRQAFSLTDKFEPNRRLYSDATAGVMDNEDDDANKVFCICRLSESGMMVECDVCHEWFHGKCLKVGRSKFKDNESFVCPVCDWKSSIPREGTRPTLEDLEFLLEQADTLPIRPDELETVRNIVEVSRKFKLFLKPILERAPFSDSDVDEVRFYLTKLEGSEVLLTDATNVLRQELHRLAPLYTDAPPMAGNGLQLSKIRSNLLNSDEEVKEEEAEGNEIRDSKSDYLAVGGVKSAVEIGKANGDPNIGMVLELPFEAVKNPTPQIKSFEVIEDAPIEVPPASESYNGQVAITETQEKNLTSPPMARPVVEDSSNIPNSQDVNVIFPDPKDVTIAALKVNDEQDYLLNNGGDKNDKSENGKVVDYYDSKISTYQPNVNREREDTADSIPEFSG